MSVTLKADEFEMRDSSGRVVVKVGTIEDDPVQYLIHFTKDGQYVDGVPTTERQSADSVYAQQIANTYAGCHAWVLVNGQWMSIVAVALPWERWSPELTNNVPEFVRAAEIMR